MNYRPSSCRCSTDGEDLKMLCYCNTGKTELNEQSNSIMLPVEHSRIEDMDEIMVCLSLWEQVNMIESTKKGSLYKINSSVLELREQIHGTRFCRMTRLGLKLVAQAE